MHAQFNAYVIQPLVEWVHFYSPAPGTPVGWITDWLDGSWLTDSQASSVFSASYVCCNETSKNNTSNPDRIHANCMWYRSYTCIHALTNKHLGPDSLCVATSIGSAVAQFPADFHGRSAVNWGGGGYMLTVFIFICVKAYLCKEEKVHEYVCFRKTSPICILEILLWSKRLCVNYSSLRDRQVSLLNTTNSSFFYNACKEK